MKVFCFEEENIGEYSREQLLEYLFAYKFYIYPDAKKREHQVLFDKQSMKK